MKPHKEKKKAEKTESSKKTEIDTTKPDAIKEKSYITREIETSITLLESPESSIVLESLLFLSKYADIQRNNLKFVQSCGLLPKLLALLDHNICILRVSLRLLSQLLTIDAAQLQLIQDGFKEQVLKICNFYVSHPDLNVREFSILVLEKYLELGKVELLLGEPDLLRATLKNTRSPETETLLDCSLELFNRLIELRQVRASLPQEPTFELDQFIAKMALSEGCFKKILAIIEKLTYFGDNALQARVKEQRVVEHVLTVIVDPDKKQHVLTCLNVLKHCMRSEVTESYFVQSLEFLKFCQWVKTCPEEAIPVCANLFLELSKIDSIRQILFDLSVEDVILSLLKNNDKKVLNTVFDAISFMSKHKYCCEKMVTPIVIRKVVQVLSTVKDNDEDPYNEAALSLLFYFSRRDPRTLYILRACSEVALLLKYLNSDRVPNHIHLKLLDIVNMFVSNNQLRSYVLSPDLYSVILAQSQSRFDEICMRCLEIMINCLNHTDFRDYFLRNRGPQIVIGKLANCTNERVVRLITIFLRNALVYENLSRDLIQNRVLLALKHLPDPVKLRNPLIGRVMSAIYDMFLPLKFFETGRLELVDRIKGRFYVLAGSWWGPFPFLEILEMRQVSTKTTIYVVDDVVGEGVDYVQWQRINQQYNQALGAASVTSLSSDQVRDYINYGGLSRDPYLPRYIEGVRRLVAGVHEVEDRVKAVAGFVDDCLCGPKEDCAMADKQHSFRLHMECIKQKLGSNMIPIGYLRLGFHCERALLFKVLADQVGIPATLVRAKNDLYWNEIGLLRTEGSKGVLKMFVVDLMNSIGQLLAVGSKECNAYCDIE